MSREGWIYGLAFAAVIAAGAAFVAPPLADRRAPGGRGPVPEPPPPEAPEPRPSAAETPAPAWVQVTVGGERGDLRGALRPVLGAESEVLDGPEARERRVRVRASGAEVAFGAAGHRWAVVPAADLREGARIRLPDAAKAIAVRVREAGGAPAAGVPVRVLPETPAGVRRTDAAGEVVLDDLPAGLVVVEVGGLERDGPTLRLRAGVDPDATATLEPAWTIRGRVVTADGAPFPGARLAVVAPRGAIGIETATDAGGRFEWAGPVEARASLVVSAPGSAEESFEVSPPADGAPETAAGDLRLASAGATVRGRVRAESIEPDARVSAEPAVAAFLREVFGPETALGLPRAVPLAPDGTFALQGLSGAFPWRVSVRGAGVPLDQIVSVGPGEVRALDLAVPSGWTLGGRVEDSGTGGPAAGLRVLASRRPVEGDREVPGDRVVVTDAEGRFRVRGLLGSVYLRAYAPGRRSLLARVDGPTTGERTFALAPALTDETRRLSGTVTGEDGTALAGVVVRAAGVAGTTDASGAFRLDGVESLAPKVVVGYGYEPGTALPEGADPRERVASARRELQPGGAAVNLVLPRAAALRFRALDGMDDRPLPWVRIVLRADEGEVFVDRTVATHGGEVSLTGLTPHGAKLAVFTPSRRLVMPVVLAPGERKDLGDLRLAVGLRVVGTVTDADGAAVARARVAALDAGWLLERGPDTTDRREFAMRRAVSGPDGSFVLEGLDPSRPTVIGAWAPGFAPASARATPGELRRERDARIEVRLKPGGTLYVTLREEGGGQPIAGGVLDLEDPSGTDYLDLVLRGVLQGEAAGTEDWRLASEALLFERSTPGTYRIGPIDPGPYEVRIEHPLYETARRRLTILPPSDNLVGDGPEANEPGPISLPVDLRPR